MKNPRKCDTNKVAGVDKSLLPLENIARDCALMINKQESQQNICFCTEYCFNQVFNAERNYNYE